MGSMPVTQSTPVTQLTPDQLYQLITSSYPREDVSQSRILKRNIR